MWQNVQDWFLANLPIVGGIGTAILAVIAAFAFGKSRTVTLTNPVPLAPSATPVASQPVLGGVLVTLAIILGILVLFREQIFGNRIGAGTSGAAQATTPSEPTSAEVDNELTTLAFAVRQGERYATGEQIETGTSPFFIRVPWSRVRGARKGKMQTAIESALQKEYPDDTVKIDDIKSVTIFRSSVQSGLGANVNCKVTLTPKTSSSGGAATPVTTEGNMPFSLSFSNGEMVEWSNDIRSKEEAYIAANRTGGAVGGVGLDPLPDLPGIGAFQPMPKN